MSSGYASHNSFDVPALRVRGATLNAGEGKLPWRRWIYPYSDEQHCDLRLVLGNDNRYARGTLSDWGANFDIHTEEQGSEIFGMVIGNEWDNITKYLEDEMETLEQMYRRVETFL